MIYSITNARKNLYKLVQEVNDNSEVITITNTKGDNAVLLSEDNWRAIQETLYLNSIPGYAEQLIELSKADDDEYISEEQVEW